MAITQWNKKYTETLGETLKRFRRENPELRDEKITYAGRLDPMAEGLVLFLTGEDVHRKDEFLGLDKTYEIDFVFGVDTDTYDILGILDDSSVKLTVTSEDLLRETLEQSRGSFKQQYPPYSSKPVDGKPLFMWARENALENVSIPVKEVEILNTEYLGKRSISFIEFKDFILKNIEKVSGDFRQEMILQSWKDFFSQHEEVNGVVIYSIRVRSSSGAYMRSLVKRIGESIGVSACSIKINRIRIGEYSVL